MGLDERGETSKQRDHNWYAESSNKHLNGPLKERGYVEQFHFNLRGSFNSRILEILEPLTAKRPHCHITLRLGPMEFGERQCYRESLAVSDQIIG